MVQKRRISVLEQRDIGDRQRTQGFAVIAVFKADKAGLFDVPAVTPKMKTHFERDFDTGSAVAAIEAVSETARRELAQAFGKFDHRFMSKTGEDDVFKFFQLLAQRGVDARVAMAEEIYPPGTDGIEITLAIKIVKPDSFPVGDRDQRQGFVLFHLGTGMPNCREAACQKFPVSHEHPLILKDLGRIISTH